MYWKYVYMMQEYHDFFTLGLYTIYLLTINKIQN